MDLDQFDGHTLGPWAKADRMNGPWWGISARHSVDGRLCENGRQSVANVHGAHRRSGYAAMFAANARLIAAAPDLLAEVRRLTAEAAALRRERDELARRNAELAARLAEIERAERHLSSETIARLMPSATISKANVERWDRAALHAFARSIERELIPRPSPAAAPEQADGCGACGDSCRSRGSCRLADESPRPAARPCRCGPDGCPDRVSCPRGER